MHYGTYSEFSISSFFVINYKKRKYANVPSTKRHLCVILTFNIRLTVFTKISGESLKINRLLAAKFERTNM